MRSHTEIYKIAFLVSISCVLQIAESLIPYPLPAMRLGLANIITLIALANLGFSLALEVSILRAILSSFIMGSFMSPAFVLSFSGALISTLIMGFFYWLSRSCLGYRLSIVGISIIGALSHILAQFYLAYLILIKHPGIFVFLPWACIGAAVTGWLTGVTAGRVCLKLKSAQGRLTLAQAIHADCRGLPLNYYSPGGSLIHRLPAERKIFGVFILALTVIMVNNFWIAFSLSLFLAGVILISRISFAFLFFGLKRYSSLIFASFLFPLFFNSAGYAEGINRGMLFTWRIIFLILLSSLLIRTTSPKQLAGALAKMLSPLRPLGICPERISAIVSLSLTAIPVFWDSAINIIRKAEFKKIKNPHNLIALLSDFIAALYLETEQSTVCRADYEKAI